MGYIFISYSHRDADYAQKLASGLQAKGFDVWIDARLDYGSQWPYEIQNRLDACSAFILIMSPRSFASEWVQSELQRAKRKAKPIFPLFLEGDEPWLSVESTQYYDVRGEKLPEDEFYSALKRSMAMKQLPASLPKASVHKTSAVKNAQPRSKRPGIFAAAGSFAAIFSACLIMTIAMLQKIGNNGLASLGPTGLQVSTSQPTLLEYSIPSPTLTSTGALPIAIEPTLISLPVELPDGPNVTMFNPTGGEFQYKILSAQRVPLLPNQHLLRLRIRIWTDYMYTFLDSASFRLAAGDLRIAPSNNLNELAERDETVDGNIEFEIDASLKEAVLVITANGYRDSWATKELRLIFP